MINSFAYYDEIRSLIQLKISGASDGCSLTIHTQKLRDRGLRDHLAISFVKLTILDTLFE